MLFFQATSGLHEESGDAQETQIQIYLRGEVNMASIKTMTLCTGFDWGLHVSSPLAASSNDFATVSTPSHAAMQQMFMPYCSLQPPQGSYMQTPPQDYESPSTEGLAAEHNNHTPSPTSSYLPSPVSNYGTRSDNASPSAFINHTPLPAMHPYVPSPAASTVPSPPNPSATSMPGQSDLVYAGHSANIAANLANSQSPSQQAMQMQRMAHMQSLRYANANPADHNGRIDAMGGPQAAMRTGAAFPMVPG
ncbi:hypothetical protein LTR36_008949 [Oleoguttula mirabilis]|uniref:Uncharacterized protein n=1 Tax=Oleoguttula mirabilis TaxID=1507867 RepID=A0AAV9J7R6_9PEZI|nr:hypothetical protein LTR36_008949 [Oleoguttula mirabilis]